MTNWAKETVDFIKKYHEGHAAELDEFAHFPSGHLGLVTPNGDLELYNGRMRAIDAEGKITLPDIHDSRYREYFAEAVNPGRISSFRTSKTSVRTRLEPRRAASRLNVADRIPTPLAQQEFEIFRAMGTPNHRSMYYHWARLIEMLHCAEVMKDLLLDEEITGDDLLREGERQPQGIGIIEAPRGTLIHYYEADEKGKVTKCNLIVSTTHNNGGEGAVRSVAVAELDRRSEITDGMLNKVEMAIRAYDPCLSCATHALGQMPLQVQVFDHEGKLVQERVR